VVTIIHRLRCKNTFRFFARGLASGVVEMIDPETVNKMRTPASSPVNLTMVTIAARLPQAAAELEIRN
jgi:hypothetical protein